MADDDGWVVVVPVKPLPLAKSRLTGFTDRHRTSLALAMAIDTVVAAASTPGVREVFVVSADPDVGNAMSPHCTVLADEPGDLDAAFSIGIATARRRHPSQRVALLVADLPGLKPDELKGALDSVGAGTLVVADAGGTGTTLLAGPPNALRPSFGEGSFSRHMSFGAKAFDTAYPAAVRPVAHAPGLRQDVDTIADLDAAVALGVGPKTSAVVAELRCGCNSPRAGPSQQRNKK